VNGSRYLVIFPTPFSLESIPLSCDASFYNEMMRQQDNSPRAITSKDFAKSRNYCFSSNQLGLIVLIAIWHKPIVYRPPITVHWACPDHLLLIVFAYFFLSDLDVMSLGIFLQEFSGEAITYGSTS
jgi:hypothetical protein